ncbi:MAG: histidinol-phosphatase [Bacteroidota bacterium]
MIRANHHAHTRFSDGRGEAEDYVQAALDAGLQVYGFSDHAPFPEEVHFGSFALTDLPEYIHTIDKLKEKYAGQIELYRSLEVDYVPGEMHADCPHIKAAQLDYTIGAVHFIDRLADGERWSYQQPDPKFQRGIDEIFGGNAQRAVERYYALIREMVTEHPTDIVAHLDRILRRNTNDRFFDRTAKWYRHAILETLEVVAHQGCILEVNTRGLYRKDNPTTYPDRWTLQRARELDIPVHLASDAHDTENIISNFDDAKAVLREVGYETTQVFLGGRWTEIEL